MNRCAAPWLELNMSGPDNRVTACCYYAGETDEWGGESLTFDNYWNSERMRYLRRLQIDSAPPPGHGCSNCHLFANQAPGYERYDYSPERAPAGLSPRQEANWVRGKQEFLAGAEVLTSRPARVYANFGFACNISCTMCHQVPRRLDNRRTMSADQLLGWGDDIEQARQMIVIGGEPFVLPQAVKFIRGFVAQESRYEAVQLGITTNGTFLHKHWDTLHRKHRLGVCISLDGIGQAFETVRLRANWADVEKNILKLVEARNTDRPEWEISTASLIQKSTLKNLPDFARWHAKHNLETVFSDFISAPGVEDTFYRENFLHNPELLADIPEWRSYFDEAIASFAKAGRESTVASLTHFKGRVEAAVAKADGDTKQDRRLHLRNDWVAQALGSAGEVDRTTNWSSTLVATPAAGQEEVSLGTRFDTSAFLRTRLGDSVATAFLGVKPGEDASFRVKLQWPRFDSAKEVVRRAFVRVENQDRTEQTIARRDVEFGLGSEMTLTGTFSPGTRAIRVVLTPVGEEVSLLPRLIEFDVDSATERRPWPPHDSLDGRWSSSMLTGLMGLFRRRRERRDAVH